MFDTEAHSPPLARTYGPLLHTILYAFLRTTGIDRTAPKTKCSNFLHAGPRLLKSTQALRTHCTELPLLPCPGAAINSTDTPRSRRMIVLHGTGQPHTLTPEQRLPHTPRELNSLPPPFQASVRAPLFQHAHKTPMIPGQQQQYSISGGGRAQHVTSSPAVPPVTAAILTARNTATATATGSITSRRLCDTTSPEAGFLSTRRYTTYMATSTQTGSAAASVQEKESIRERGMCR